MINHRVEKKHIKTIDGDISIIKLIESEYKDKRVYTVEITQGDFITEMQYGYKKQKAFIMYNVLCDSNLDIYIDKTTSKGKLENCSCCNITDTMLNHFDNNMALCENCSSVYGIDI